MDNNLRYIQKQIDKHQAEARAAQRLAVAERSQADSYIAESELGERDRHLMQAERYDQEADRHEAEAQALEPKKAELEARVNELKAERDTINRQVLDRTMAIDKELEGIQ
jgi:chromosome segregation ATPase